MKSLIHFLTLILFFTAIANVKSQNIPAQINQPDSSRIKYGKWVFLNRSKDTALVTSFANDTVSVFKPGCHKQFR